jgi:hypothetical protein
MRGAAKDFMALQYAAECFDLRFQKPKPLLERKKRRQNLQNGGSDPAIRVSVVKPQRGSNRWT